MQDFQEIKPWESSTLPAPVFSGPVNQVDLVRYKAPERRAEAPESLMIEYIRLLARRRSMIALFTVFGAMLGYAVTLAVLPVYRARTSLDIQNLNADFLNMRNINQTSGGENASTESYVQTQIRLLQSDTLRSRAVDDMKKRQLAQPMRRDDMLSSVKRDLHLPGEKPVTRLALLEYVAKNVTVKPLGVTRLVEMTCDSWNAKLSAEFCNTMTDQFAKRDREVRLSEAEKTSEWLSHQLADVRDSLAKSEKKLEDATGNDALSITQGGTSVADDKLRQLQTELTKAQSERVAKQASYEISKSASPESLPMVLDSGSFRESQTKVQDLRRQVAALVPPLTEANPKVQHLRAQIAELEGNLASEKSNLMQRIQHEFEEAKHREALLLSAYSSQERTVTKEQGKQAQLSMLHHEVDSSQQLYQTLLQRVKEAGFASAMQASTIRVVDAAKPPETPIAPRRGLSTGVGLLLGMLAGICAAFIKERTQTLLRAPGDVPRYLALRELGVIPSARRTLRNPHSGLSLLPARIVSWFQPAAEPAVADMRPQRALDMAVWQDHASLVAEAFRNTTYSILLAGGNDRAKTYVVSSPNVGEGKTTVTCNLGLALAQANRRVLLIDGDLRKPRLHKAMGLSNETGLRNLLRGDFDVLEAPTESFCQPTKVPDLFVITSGTGSEEPGSLIHSPRFKTLIDRLAGEFDIVLIDSPPMLHLADARIIGGVSNGVILVFRARKTDRETALNSRDLFLNDDVRVIGTILNDFDPLKEGKSQYYGSYYAYREKSRETTGESQPA